MSVCSSHVKTEVDIMWTNQHGTGPKTDDRVETQVIYSTCASRSRMERCPQVMWMPTTNITPFEMVKQPLLTHLLTILRSHIKFRNITDFMSRTITRYRNKGKIAVYLSPSLCASIYQS